LERVMRHSVPHDRLSRRHSPSAETAADLDRI
jgi:hypothetical protein